MGSLCFEAQCCVPVLLENLHGLGLKFVDLWVGLGFSVGMETFG